MRRAAALVLLAALAAGPASAQAPAAPVRIEETGKNPDGPPTPADAAYDSRLRSSMASAQAFQGPMDGGWTLLAAGQELFVFQLTDRAGLVDGAWRDVRRTGALDASGFLDQVERGEGGLRFRIGDRIVALHSDGDGRWSGELTEGGASLPVTLRRRNP